MFRAFARHKDAKGVPDAWWLVFVGLEEKGTIDKAYEELLKLRGDLDEETVRERYVVHVVEADCNTEVFDPALVKQIPCGVFGIFCPTCEFKLETYKNE